MRGRLSCAAAGALAFAAACGAAMAIAAGMYGYLRTEIDGTPPGLIEGYRAEFFRVLSTGVPAAALLGAVAGFLAWRPAAIVAAGEMEDPGGWERLLRALGRSAYLLVFAIHLQRRLDRLRGRRRTSWVLAEIVAVLAFGWTVFLGLFARQYLGDEFGLAVASAGLASIAVADAILVETVSGWRASGRLAPAPPGAAQGPSALAGLVQLAVGTAAVGYALFVRLLGDGRAVVLDEALDPAAFSALAGAGASWVHAGGARIAGRRPPLATGLALAAVVALAGWALHRWYLEQVEAQAWARVEGSLDESEWRDRYDARVPPGLRRPEADAGRLAAAATGYAGRGDAQGLRAVVRQAGEGRDPGYLPAFEIAARALVEIRDPEGLRLVLEVADRFPAEPRARALRDEAARALGTDPRPGA